MKDAVNAFKRNPGAHYRVPGYKRSPDSHGRAIGFKRIMSPQSDSRSGYKTTQGGR